MDQLPAALLDMQAELARQDAYRASLQGSPKLPKPLTVGEGDCGHSKGISFVGRAPDEATLDAAWSILAMNAAHDPACAQEPLGWAETEIDGSPAIEVYWRQAA